RNPPRGVERHGARADPFFPPGPPTELHPHTGSPGEQARLRAQGATLLHPERTPNNLTNHPCPVAKLRTNSAKPATDTQKRQPPAHSTATMSRQSHRTFLGVGSNLGVGLKPRVGWNEVQRQGTHIVRCAPHLRRPWNTTSTQRKTPVYTI